MGLRKECVIQGEIWFQHININVLCNADPMIYTFTSANAFALHKFGGIEEPMVSLTATHLWNNDIMPPPINQNLWISY